MLQQLRPYCASHTRLIFNFHSHLWNVPLSGSAGIGRFDDTGNVGVLLWNSTHLDIVPAGPFQAFVTVERYSRADMR